MNRIIAIAIGILVMSASSRPSLLASSQETVSSGDSIVTHSSTLWKNASEDIVGGWRFEDRGESGAFVVFTDSFRTASAPDLKIALSPLRQKDITRKNALEGALVIGQLTRSSGRQEFRIPDDTDVSAFSTLVIHCEQYSKLWGTSIIREGRVIASAPSWIKKTKRTRGGYEIVTREDGLFLRFGDDFRTPKAPEPLRVLLSTQSAKEATNKSAERDATLVATTSQYSGGQEFRLPEDIDLSKYRSVLLNCLKYTKLWSAAPLE